MPKHVHTRALNHTGDVIRGRLLALRAAARGIFISDEAGNEVLAAEIHLRGLSVTADPDDDNIALVGPKSGIGQKTNSSATDTIPAYAVVVTDPDNDDAVVLADTAQITERGIGVAQEDIAPGQMGAVMFAGETPIQLTAAGTRGTFVETSATAGEAGTNATRRAGSFGVLVEGADPADATLTGLADLLIDSAVTQSTVAGTSINATMPTTVPIGTLLILSLWLQGTASSPTISGWTRIGSTSGFRYYTRVADGTEGSTVAISWTGSSQAVVSILVLDGIDTGSPVAGFDYDSTTGAASVSGLTSASYLALAAVNALAAVPDAWTVLGSGSAGSGGGTASIVQSAHAGPFSSFGGTLNLPSPVTPGNLLVLVEAGGNYFSHNDLNLSPSAGGSARPFTAFTPNVATTDSFGDDQMAMAYRVATGDEQNLFFSGETENFHVFVYEIANAGDPTGFEVRHLSHQAAASTKSLGAFGTAGDVQLMGMIVAETATDQTVGTGYTQDLQVTIAKPTFVVAHDTAGHTPQISGASHEWAGIAVGITGASSLVQGEIVGQLFAGTGATSPFTGASAQDDALIVLALAITPFVSVPVARALLWGGDPDLSDGGGGSVDVLYDNGPGGSTPAIDWSNGDVQQLTLNAATVTPTFSGVPAAPAFLRLELYQDVVGGRVVDWSSIPVSWPDGVPPTLNPDPTGLTAVDFESDDGGTSFLGSYRPSQLDDLADVDLSTPPAGGDALVYDAGSGTWKAGTASTVAALDDLTDVAISSPLAGQLLRYNGSLWVNAALVAGDYPYHAEPLCDSSGPILQSNGDVITVTGVPD